ncbi:hypothetical protein [Helicobacter pylori]|uniref:hypothetical protein n=1 Tax=Helicobacter pylori TaxID=210 RepID=UPI000EB13416|nr:hypothetical protein [Helicobacter pylori]RKV07086.1 hypothetical protein DDP47_07525 [Helicobacter pylori]
MKIKAIMLCLAVSGALLFGKELSLEQREKIIDSIEVNPMNPEYIKFLSKKIMQTNEIVGFNHQKQKSQISLVFGMNATNSWYNIPIHSYLA